MKHYTEQELLENEKLNIQNSIIKNIDLNVVGHYGNCVCVEVICKNVTAIGGWNNTESAGKIIKELVVLLGLDIEDGRRVSSIKDVPCRLVIEGGFLGKCVGIGHFMNDDFVLTEELMTEI